MAYCPPDEHTWVQVVGGKGHDEGWDVTVCIYCHCFNGVRKSGLKHTARPPHPSTQIGKRCVCDEPDSN